MQIEIYSAKQDSRGIETCYFENPHEMDSSQTSVLATEDILVSALLLSYFFQVEKVVNELTERLQRFNIRTFRALHQR